MDAKQALEKLINDQPGALSLLQHLTGDLPDDERTMIEDELVHLTLPEFAPDVHAAVRRRVKAMKASN